MSGRTQADTYWKMCGWLQESIASAHCVLESTPREITVQSPHFGGALELLYSADLAIAKKMYSYMSNLSTAVQNEITSIPVPVLNVCPDYLEAVRTMQAIQQECEELYLQMTDGEESMQSEAE